MDMSKKRKTRMPATIETDNIDAPVVPKHDMASATGKDSIPTIPVNHYHSNIITISITCTGVCNC